MTSQARIRLVTEGVVASYIHDISARAHTTDVRSRDDAVLAADHGYSAFIPYHGTRKAAHRPRARSGHGDSQALRPIRGRPLHHCGD
jgi:hypothetical protein